MNQKKMIKNNIEIIPYTEVDGIRTYKDSFIMELYDKIIEDGYGYMFDNGVFKSRDKFLYIMKHTNNILYVMYIDKELAGVVWLNDFNGKVANMHWCTYNGFSVKQKIHMFREMAKQLLHIKEKDDSYLFDLFVGFVPASNMKAVKFTEKVGAKIVGKIPHMMWNERKGKSEPGYMVYYHRGIRNEDIQ